MDGTPGIRTRHAKAAEPPTGKVIGYFTKAIPASVSNLPPASPVASPRSGTGTSHITITSPRTIAKRGSTTHESREQADQQPLESPRRAAKMTAKASSSTPAKPTAARTPRAKKTTHKEQADMDIDEPGLESEVGSQASENEMIGVEPLLQDNDDLNQEPLEEEEEEPKAKSTKKRARTEQSPPKDEVKKRSSSLKIATKKSAAASAEELMKEFDDNDVDLPKSPNKKRTRDQLTKHSTKTPKKRSSPDYEDIARARAKKAQEEDGEVAGEELKPPRKRQKVGEHTPRAALGTPAKKDASSSTAHTPTASPVGHFAPAATTPTQHKSPSLWSGFVSRSIQRLKGMAANSPKSPPSEAIATPHTPAEAFSPLPGDARVINTDTADSIVSPAFRATASVPRDIGSPLRNALSNNDFYPDSPNTYGTRSFEHQREDYSYTSGFRAPPYAAYDDYDASQASNVQNDRSFLDHRSASVGNFGNASPQRFGVPMIPQSPTSRFGTTQQPSNHEWVMRQTQSPARTPLRPFQIQSPIPSASPRAIPHPPVSLAEQRHRPNVETQEEERPKSWRKTTMERVRTALCTLFFRLIVVALVVFVVWLFFGTDIVNFISGTPQKRLEYCREALFKELRRQRGLSLCDPSLPMGLSTSELRVRFPHICPYEDVQLADVQRELLKNKDVGTSDAHTLFYKGTAPFKPLMCALRDGIMDFVWTHLHWIALLLVFGVAVVFWVIRLQRRNADKVLAKSIADKIIEQIKEEHQKSPDGYVIKDYMEEDYGKTKRERSVWPQVVELVESNIRVRVLPRIVHGDQLVTWVWS